MVLCCHIPPLHYLLFDKGIEVLIATSGNVSGNPLEYQNGGVFENLKGIADYVLGHNREIYVPVDDSVVRVVGGKKRVIRRARGYVPQPLMVGGP